MADGSDWCLGLVGCGEFGIFAVIEKRGRVHVSGLLFILRGSYYLHQNITV